MTLQELVPDILRRLCPHSTGEQIPLPLIYDAIMSVVSRAVLNMQASPRVWRATKLTTTAPATPGGAWDVQITNPAQVLPVAATFIPAANPQSAFNLEFVAPHNFAEEDGPRYTLILGSDGTRILRFSQELASGTVEVWFESEAIDFSALPIPSNLFRQMIVVEAALILYPHVPDTPNKTLIGQMLIREAEEWRVYWNEYLTRPLVSGPIKKKPWRRRLLGGNLIRG